MTRLAIIGWPVGHSRSPLIHNHWLKQHAIDAVYETRPIAPEENFRAALQAMAAEGFVGANVTLPHKEAAFQAMDEVSAQAKALGAVNTIVFKGDRLIGHNTDGDGFLASLDAAGVADWRQKPALVLGAGGAARAIIAALARAALPVIYLSNRTRAKAEALQGLSRTIQIGDWAARDALAEGCGLLVNTTSLGMAGQPALSMALDKLAVGAVVSDIVYAPLETDLLRAANAAGFAAIDGLGMLVQQAALAFEIWFGIKPDFDAALRAALLADLRQDEGR